MKVTVENKKGLNKDLKVFIDKKTISSYMDEKYEEVKNSVNLKDVHSQLNNFPGITVMDDPKRDIYPMPYDIEGKDDVYVGRIRKDTSVDNGIVLWIVSDNLRKGAALNSLQIAETLVKSELV